MQTLHWQCFRVTNASAGQVHLSLMFRSVSSIIVNPLSVWILIIDLLLQIDFMPCCIAGAPTFRAKMQIPQCKGERNDPMRNIPTKRRHSNPKGRVARHEATTRFNAMMAVHKDI
jgi:hypothetical protein